MKSIHSSRDSRRMVVCVAVRSDGIVDSSCCERFKTSEQPFDVNAISAAQSLDRAGHEIAESGTQALDSFPARVVAQPELCGDLAVRQSVRQLREDLRILLAERLPDEVTQALESALC